MKRPLIPVALYYASGLLLAEIVSPPLPLLFGICFLLLLVGWSQRGWRAPLLGLFLIGLGMTNLLRLTTPIAPDDLRQQLTEAPVLATVRGTLSETPNLRLHEHDGKELVRTLVTLRVSALRTNDEWKPAFGQVLVTTQGELTQPLFGGEEVEIYGVLGPPPSAMADGLFNYRTYLARQNIYYQLKTTAADWHGLNPNVTPPFADRFIAWAKNQLAYGLPAPDEPLRLLWAMTLGWKTALTGEVSEPFMKTGTMHIFAISGLHIALIAGILVSLLRGLRVPRGGCGLVVIPLLWFYTAATGWQPSAIRSTLMMTIVVGGWALARPSDLLNSLAAAAFIILLWQPQQLFQASFQLSFFVVLSIALFVPPLQRWLDQRLAYDPLLPPEVIPRWKRTRRWLLRAAAMSFATSLAAWLGALPLTAYYFHIFSPVTLLANLLIVPLSSLALACNLGSLLCGAWWPWLSELFNHAAWFWMLGMIKLCDWATLIPGAYAFVRAPSLFTFIVYYGLLTGFMSGWLWRPGRRQRTLIILGALGLYYGGQWLGERRNFTLTVLPFAGGHAEYFDAAGKSQDWLVDCGNSNSVVYVTRPFLRAQGVTQLPRLLLTHGDLRQVGGTELLLDEFRCREVFVSPLRFRSPIYRRIMADLQSEPFHLKTIARGDFLPPWRILHPASTDSFTQADDGALVRQAEFYGATILLLSDLGRLGQNLLLEREGQQLRSDLLVAGLPEQTEALTDALLDAVQPRVIIVADSDFPATARASLELKARLEPRRVLTLYTRTVGAVTISFRPDGCELATADGQTFELEKLPAMTPNRSQPRPVTADREW